MEKKTSVVIRYSVFPSQTPTKIILHHHQPTFSIDQGGGKRLYTLRNNDGKGKGLTTKSKKKHNDETATAQRDIR